MLRLRTHGSLWSQCTNARCIGVSSRRDSAAQACLSSVLTHRPLSFTDRDSRWVLLLALEPLASGGSYLCTYLASLKATCPYCEAALQESERPTRAA